MVQRVVLGTWLIVCVVIHACACVVLCVRMVTMVACACLLEVELTPIDCPLPQGKGRAVYSQGLLTEPALANGWFNLSLQCLQPSELGLSVNTDPDFHAQYLADVTDTLAFEGGNCVVLQAVDARTSGVCSMLCACVRARARLCACLICMVLCVCPFLPPPLLVWNALPLHFLECLHVPVTTSTMPCAYLIFVGVDQPWSIVLRKSTCARCIASFCAPFCPHVASFSRLLGRAESAGEAAGATTYLQLYSSLCTLHAGVWTAGVTFGTVRCDTCTPVDNSFIPALFVPSRRWVSASSMPLAVTSEYRVPAVPLPPSPRNFPCQRCSSRGTQVDWSTITATFTLSGPLTITAVGVCAPALCGGACALIGELFLGPTSAPLSRTVAVPIAQRVGGMVKWSPVPGALWYNVRVGESTDRTVTAGYYSADAGRGGQVVITACVLSTELEEAT